MTEPEQWAVVQEVETVTGDFLSEPGVPFYRIVIDGYCADFDYREAAENFANAINQMVARHHHQAERGEVVAWMYEKNGKVLLDHGPTCSDDMVSGGWAASPLYTLPTPPEAV